MAKIQLLVGERQARESRSAVIACNDFLRLGPGRKLTSLAQQYGEMQSDARVPTRSIHTLNRWSSKYAWAERAETYDAQLEAEKNAAEEQRRQQILNTGLALTHERVAALKDVADYLLGQIQEVSEPAVAVPAIPEFAGWQSLGSVPDTASPNATPVPSTKTRPNVWLKDVKQIGSGESAERVDIVRFNAAMFEQLRGTLDDIAKEVGGRVQRQEVSGKNGGVIETKSSVTIDLSTLTIEQLTALAQSLKD